MAKRKKFKRSKELTKQIPKETRQLLNKITTLQREANQRLRETQRIYGTNTWASKKLQQRLEILDAWSINDQVTLGINKTNVTRLRGIEKALKNFLASKTSTVKGIRATIKKQAKSLGDIYLDEEDVETHETMYDFMSDEDFRDVSRYIGASELVALLEYAKDNNLTKRSFLNEIENYLSFGNDSDMKDELLRIYNKYVL